MSAARLAELLAATDRDHSPGALPVVAIAADDDKEFVDAIERAALRIVSLERRGAWHGDWSPELQSRWISRMFAVAMSKPFVESIFWSDMVDHDEAELLNAGLIDSDGKPKPALQRLVSMRKKLRKPLGELNLPSKASADEG